MRISEIIYRYKPTSFDPRRSKSDLYRVAFEDGYLQRLYDGKLTAEDVENGQRVAVALLNGLKKINPKTMEKLTKRVQYLLDGNGDPDSGQPTEDGTRKLENAWIRLFNKVTNTPEFKKLESSGIDVHDILDMLYIPSSFGSESLKERVLAWNMFTIPFGIEIQTTDVDRIVSTLNQTIQSTRNNSDENDADYWKKLNESKHMNREKIKKAIKKLVIQEITNNQFGTQIHTDKKDTSGEDALSKAMGKDAAIMHIRGTGKTAGIKGNQEVQLSKNCDHCYDVVSITNESERKIARGVSLEAAMELVKQHAESSDKTYVQKAYDKTSQGHGLKAEKKEEKEEADKMDDVDEEKQVEIADDTTVKAEEKADKDTAPINKDVAPALGGDIVDKIEKIVDRVLKDKTKADAKSSYLKHDTDTESPDKLSVKLKDTPALKEVMKKSDLKKLTREVIEETLCENDEGWKNNPEDEAKAWQEFYSALDQGMNPRKALTHLNPIFSKELFWQLVAAALMQEKDKLRLAGFDDMEPADTENALKNFAANPDTSFFTALNRSPNTKIEGKSIKDVPLYYFNFVLQSPQMESSPRLQQKFKSKFHMLALSSAEKYKDDLDIGI